MNAPPPFLAKWIAANRIELGIARRREARLRKAEAARRGHHTELQRRVERARAVFGEWV